MGEAIIQAEHLTIGYRQGKRGNKEIHSDLSFSLFKGELTCLLGPNGAGKSTLLRTISGSQKALDGALYLNGKEMTAYREKEIAGLIGLVLTDRTMAGGLTVFELVALGRHPHTGFWGQLKEHDHKVVCEALESVGIADKASHYVSELSDGERQKVMIAKALAQECPVLLLDEPTAFLDVVSRIEIMNLLRELAVKRHKTILLSTHDLEQALLLGDKLWLLSKDNGLLCGTTEDLIFSGSVDRFFSRGKIVFDPMRGSFRPESPTGYDVFVEASDEFVVWTTNLLMRNGCGITNSSDAAHAILRVLSATHIEFQEPGNPLVYMHSFSEVAEFFRKFHVS